PLRRLSRWRVGVRALAPPSLHESAPPRHPRPSPTRRSSDLPGVAGGVEGAALADVGHQRAGAGGPPAKQVRQRQGVGQVGGVAGDRKSTRLNSSHVKSSYAVFGLKEKKR